MGNRALYVIAVIAYRLLLASLSAEAEQIIESYVVYMGSPSAGGGGDAEATRDVHLQMLSSIVPSDEPERQATLTQSYHHAFEGFAALLTEQEAAALSGHERVVSVFRDRALQLHTTRSWDFLDVQSGLRPDLLGLRPDGLGLRPSADVIIGVVDTGVWPESRSFNDDGMGEVPARWRGVCLQGPDFKKTNCNKKLIGARYYGNLSSASLPGTKRATGSPRDTVGHGTHCASTAAGAVLADADYYGLARGVAKGGAPASRIASYKVCSEDGCSGSALLKGIDDAVSDGVDVISISIGMGSSSGSSTDFLSDPIALGAFHAQQKGVLVVCSAGNDGPDPHTVANTAPWVLTVAASSIDRAFQSTIVLGNGNAVKGVGINFSNQSLSGRHYPLVFGPRAAARHTPVSESSNCYPGSLDERKVAGKIVVCLGTDTNLTRRIRKLVVEDAGASGMILIDDASKIAPIDAGSFAFSQVGADAGILEYIKSTKKPTAVILPTKDVREFKPAPIVALFSSRGPAGLTESILKPDLMAPGVSILAAAIPPMHKADVPAGKKHSAFAIKSGTSMACPHVAGAGAFIKSAHPGWSPVMIRSALMTTATTMNNLGQPVSSSTGAVATGHDMGAGEISPLRALSPGLVFDTTTKDYLNFLCYYGYKQKLIRRISGDKRFACPSGALSPDLIATDFNYPSISVPRLLAGKAVAVSRTATNVGSTNATYVAAVEAPAGLTVKVSPERLAFPRRWTTAAYEVSFHGAGVSKGYAYGAVTWSDGAHFVRTPFAVNVV